MLGQQQMDTEMETEIKTKTETDTVEDRREWEGEAERILIRDRVGKDEVRKGWKG